VAQSGAVSNTLSINTTGSSNNITVNQSN
jgi:hypothetical protein